MSLCVYFFSITPKAGNWCAGRLEYGKVLRTSVPKGLCNPVAADFSPPIFDEIDGDNLAPTYRGGILNPLRQFSLSSSIKNCTFMKKSLFITSLILTMLVTGVFWGTWFTLTRSLDQFPPDNFIRIGKTIIHNVAWPMRILMPATIVALIALNIATYKLRPGFYFFATALVLMVVTLIITVGVEVPIDNKIKTWTAETIPANWQDLRSTWDKFHSLRTFTSLLSFVTLSIGVVYFSSSSDH